MPDQHRGAVSRQIRRLFGTGTVAGLSESQLLEQFLTRRDEVAFQVLVERHGPLVLAVCRQFLNDANDVEDAFQATFLVLVQKAGAIRRRQSLAAWLYGVAYRVSMRARAQAACRRSRERPAGEEPAMPPDPGPTELDDLRPVLFEELSRLPEKYRQPLVLCYLEGRTHHQAADQLSWPVGTVRGRLARARDLLRRRLLRRGITVSSLVLGTSLSKTVSGAPLPPVLAESTVRAALAFTSRTASAGVLSASVTTLSQGVIRAMFLSQLKTALVAGGLMLGVAATGVGVLAYQDNGRQQAGPVRQGQEVPSGTPEEALPKPSGLLIDQVNELGDPNAATEWELRLRNELEILEVNLRAKEADLQKADAQLQLARAVAARFQRLAEGHAVSAEEAAQTDAQLKLAQANFKKAQAELDETKTRIAQMQKRINALQSNRSQPLRRNGETSNTESKLRLRDELEILARNLRAREAELQKAQAQLGLAQAVWQGKLRLFKARETSTEEVTKAQADVNVAEAELKIKQASVDEAKTRIEQMQRRLRSPETNTSQPNERDGGTPSGEWERRLKELELRVDELTREVQTLKREGSR